MTIEELIAQAAKDIIREQMAAAIDSGTDADEEDEVEVSEPSAEALTSSAKSGC